MGVELNVGFEDFPEQDRWLGKRVEVCFHYEPMRSIGGFVVRSDKEAPGRMIIRLDDQRYVMATECMWRPIDNE